MLAVKGFVEVVPLLDVGLSPSVFALRWQSGRCAERVLLGVRVRGAGRLQGWWGRWHSCGTGLRDDVHICMKSSFIVRGG